MVKLFVILRGHERNTLKHGKLRRFITRLTKTFGSTLHVVVHTWNKTEASLSWRKLEHTPRKITKDDITSYFDIHVECIIDNEHTIELHGNKNGYLGACTNCVLETNVVRSIQSN